MDSPKFSVVIPAYSQAQFIPDAIESILNQTYTNFEILVVNDASPDNTSEVVRQYTDPRIKLIIHEKNKGLPSARNTGMRAACGEYIALLDADDYFHEHKLAEHKDLYQKNPEIDVSYNPRFDLNHSKKTIRELYRPPLKVTLHDLVLGFPFSPSDMVFRLDCVNRFGLFDEQLVNGAEDMDYPCRLALGGCKFQSVDKALNYRRYHSSRSPKDISKRKQEYDIVLARTFQDPRCPTDVIKLYNNSFTKHDLNLAYVAFAQENTNLGQEIFHEAFRLNPAIITGNPCKAIDFFMLRSISDQSQDHTLILNRIFTQFPQELAHLSDQYDWAVKQGYLLKGLRLTIWGYIQEGEASCDQAFKLSAKFDTRVSQIIKGQLRDIEEVLGDESVKKAIENLSNVLKKHKRNAILLRIQASMLTNQAFRYYRNREYGRVPICVVQAIYLDPTLAINRGMLSIFFRSLCRR